MATFSAGNVGQSKDMHQWPVLFGKSGWKNVPKWITWVLVRKAGYRIFMLGKMLYRFRAVFYKF